MKINKNILNIDEKLKLNDLEDVINVPNFTEIVIGFNTENELETYIRDKNYLHNDGIYMSITLNSFDLGKYDYTLKYNISDGNSPFLSENSYILFYNIFI